MANATAKGNGDPPAEEAKPGPPTERFKVVSSFATDQGRVLFSSVSEKRARRFVETRFPRGSEAHLVLPDGTTESYENERTGPYGEDMDPWGPFDAEAWRPVSQQAPPGESAWADVEG